MITIDGSSIDGGGQILRSSLALSVLTQQPFKIIKIRANRPNPGLREQHLQSVRAVKRLCNAEVKGDKLQSRELTFIPNKIAKKKLKVKINTAGATSLLLQTLFLASLKNDLKIRIEGGGTWNLHAPSIAYLQEAFIPLLNLNNKINVIKDGFYPKGGAILETHISKNKIKFAELIERRELKIIRGTSIASEYLKKANVSKRQIIGALNTLTKLDTEILIKEEYTQSLSPGSGILLVAEYKNTILSFDIAGERGKQSEIIGKQAASGLLEDIQSQATVDRFMLDQILPFLAYENGGLFKFHNLTDHTKTNMETIKRFIDVKFKIKDNTLGVH